MSFIELKNVCKKYDKTDKNAVTDFNLSIGEKEFVAFVGPSGCGKSTTLRMIAGFEEISSGELYIGGRKMNEVAPMDRGISMVFQNYALYPHMTVEKNISYRNILLCTLVLMTAILCILCLVTDAGIIGALAVAGSAGISLTLSLLVRRILMH